MSFLWHTTPSSQISLTNPLSYADRLRIRQPGDASFALGPHMDGGSVERWEKNGYGAGGVYDAIFAGDWETYDPWDASGRIDAVNNLYDGLGACSMFRMWQGWLSMSRSGPNEGTLLVNPLMRLATVYLLLRPFFKPVQDFKSLKEAQGDGADFLHEENWAFAGEEGMTSELQGATLGRGQEFTNEWHPHLELEKTMVHMPDIQPGDFVAWHCDSEFSLHPRGSTQLHPHFHTFHEERNLTAGSYSRRRQETRRQLRLQRSLHPRMSRNDHQRRVPRKTAGSIPQGDPRTRLPRRRRRSATRGSANGRNACELDERRWEEGYGTGETGGHPGGDARAERSCGESECHIGVLGNEFNEICHDPFCFWVICHNYMCNVIGKVILATIH